MQKNVEDKAKELQEKAERTINDQMDRVDSTFQNLDTAIQKKIDRQLEKADTLLEKINEKI